MIIFRLIVILLAFIGCNDNKYNQRAIELNQKAEELIHKRKASEALNLLDEAIKLDSSYYLAYGNKMGILIRDFNFKEAIEVGKLQLKHSPDFAMGYLFVGLILTYDNQNDEAKLYFKKSIHSFQNKIDRNVDVYYSKLHQAIAYKLIDEGIKAKNNLDYLMTIDEMRETAILYKDLSKEELLNLLRPY